jgi:hypothetical protein
MLKSILKAAYLTAGEHSIGRKWLFLATLKLLYSMHENIPLNLIFIMQVEITRHTYRFGCWVWYNCGEFDMHVSSEPKRWSYSLHQFLGWCAAKGIGLNLLSVNIINILVTWQWANSEGDHNISCVQISWKWLYLMYYQQYIFFITIHYKLETSCDVTVIGRVFLP